MNFPLSVATAAAAFPALLAYNVSPSPTFLNQALGLALWTVFALNCLSSATSPGRLARGSAPLLAALGLLLFAAALACGAGALPPSLGLSAMAILLAAAFVLLGGAGGASGARMPSLFTAFCWAWLVTAVLNCLLALIQVFAPELTDGDILATSGLPGRAVGNLRQPNHLSSLLLWGCITTVALHELKKLGSTITAALLAAMLFAVVLTASRTGLLSVFLLAAWGAFDRRMSKPGRLLLLAAPLIYAAAWFGMAEWAKLADHTFGGTARLAEGDISGSRFGIWRNTLTLIAQNPWTGVGFGEFNFAWTLTPFPGRPTAFFDHAHNLPLQLAVELGLPLASLVMALLLFALWRALRLSFGPGPSAEGDVGIGRRAATLMVLMIGLHSLLEYPLWYSYFLLPTAWAWGFALGTGKPAPAGAEGASAAPSRLLQACGVAMVVGSLLAVLDYTRVTAIFTAAEGAPPLEQRIAAGQRSVLFAHHADYAAATTDIALQDPLQPFKRATHFLLDTRLMMAWAHALARQGQVDEARFLAARLREFRNPASDEFFAVCDAPAAASSPAGVTAAAVPFQCQPPQRQHDWRAFRMR